MRLTIYASALVLFYSPYATASSDVFSAKSFADSCQVYSDIMEGEADRKYAGDDIKAMNIRMFQAGLCSGFIDGFVAGHSYGTYELPRGKFCLPPSVTTAQLARVAVKLMRQTPEVENESAIVLMAAVALQFPCPKR